MDRTSERRKREARTKNVARETARIRPALSCGCREEVQTFGQAACRVMLLCPAHEGQDKSPWGR